MNEPVNKLLDLRCRHYSKGESSLNLSEVEHYRRFTPEWQFCATENELSRTYHFDSYADTIAFVNSVASVAQEQDHHPDLEVNYNRCKVCFRTHSVNGVTENDFICAANIDHRVD